MVKSVTGKIDIAELQPQKPAQSAPDQQEYIALIGYGAFPDKSAIIPVRLHNTDLTGEKFTAIMKAAQLRFDKYTLVMMDSIENHIIDEGGRAKAQKWIKTNKPALSKRDLETMLTWQDIRDLPDFDRKHGMLQLLYQTNKDARYYVNWACANRMGAIKKQCAQNGVEFNEQDMMKRVLHYRLEELAGLSVLRDKADIPEICPEDFVNDDLLYDRLSTEKLAMPRVFPVTFQLVNAGTPPLSFED